MRRSEYPKDSIHMVGVSTATNWLKRFESSQLHGLHEDAFIQLLGHARHDRDAQTLITKRLADPKLRVNDLAYILQISVVAVAQPGDSAATRRLAIAEQYMAQLERLGTRDPVVATRALYAHQALVAAYHEAHRHPDVIRHGVAIGNLLQNVIFFARTSVLWGTQALTNRTLEHVGEAMSLEPDGKAQFERLKVVLERAATPPNDSVALDSVFYWLGRSYMRTIEANANMFAMQGLKRGDIYMNSWINMPDSGPGTMRVNNGKVHVVEIGGYTCGGCIQGLAALQRMHEVFPTIVPVFLTTTMGTWGNRSLAPDSEAVFLRSMFRDQRKVTVPIGLWLVHRVMNEDGDLVPDPNEEIAAWKQYTQFGKPSFYVIDGEGRIRKTYATYTRDVEKQLIADVRYLLDEQRTKTGVAPADAGTDIGTSARVSANATVSGEVYP